MLEETASSTFEKIVYVKRKIASVQEPRKVSVNRTDNSFLFRIVADLRPYDASAGIREYYIFKTTWLARAKKAGDYCVSVRTTTNHSDAHDNFKSKNATSNFVIVSGAPIINSLDVPNRSYSPGLNDSEWYVPPGEDMEVRCQVTCPTRVQNVTIYYTVWPNNNWSSNAMTNSSNSEWIGYIPEQQEGTLILFYVEAFSSTESAIEKGRPCRLLDLKMLEHEARIDIAVTLTIIFVGCLIFFAVKKRNMSELL